MTNRLAINTRVKHPRHGLGIVVDDDFPGCPVPDGWAAVKFDKYNDIPCSSCRIENLEIVVKKRWRQV